MEENPLPSSQNEGSDVEIEYDEDGNPIPPPKKRYIDPLPPIDHSEIVYEPFEKNFYMPHEDIVNLSPEKVEDLKNALGIKVLFINLFKLNFIFHKDNKDIISKLTTDNWCSTA